MPDIIGLKSCDFITVPLGIPDVKGLSVHLNERGDVIITVESSQEGTLCQHGGRKITKFHGRDRWVELRHLPILGRRNERKKLNRLFDHSPELKLAYYFVDRLSSGFVEGLNSKVKTIKRRCYGIPRVRTLFQRLYLDLEGYRRFA